NQRLPKALMQRIESGQEALAISSVSIYEFVFQCQRGRIAIDLPMDVWLRAATVEAGIDVLDVTTAIASYAATLPLHHGDPVDRIIIASAVQHNAHLMSVDTQFLAYDALQGHLIATR